MSTSWGKSTIQAPKWFVGYMMLSTRYMVKAFQLYNLTYCDYPIQLDNYVHNVDKPEFKREITKQLKRKLYTESPKKQMEFSRTIDLADSYASVAWAKYNYLNPPKPGLLFASHRGYSPRTQEITEMSGLAAMMHNTIKFFQQGGLDENNSVRDL